MKSKKQSINILTLGCSKNTVDSEHLAGMLPAEKYSIGHDANGAADVVIINTCGFIGDAKEESVNTILEYAEARKQGAISQLIVMGCLTQRYQKELEAEIHEVDAFFGANDLKSIASFLGATNLGGAYHYRRKRSGGKHFAYLKVSEGCDRNCSFCAIPAIRGKHISVPIADLVEEATYLAKSGVKEVILIAQDLTYYGIDLYGERKLVQLVEALSDVKGIEWIRLQYAYPHAFPEGLTQLIQSNPKVCKYIDLPLQHINTEVLKSMKRHIDREKTLALVEKIRRDVPGIAFRTTLIVGYPGETDDAFNELLEFVKTQNFERLGVFAYSPEEGTPAFELKDDVPDEIKQQRVETIMEVQQQISLEHNLKRIGTTEKVIIDRIEADYFVGRTQYDSPEVDNEVLISTQFKQLKPGAFVEVEIIDADYFDLYAKVV